MKTPWQRADATGNEHAHQSALFQWAAMAAFAGVVAADDPASYAGGGHWQKLVQAGQSKPDSRFSWLHAIHNQGHGDAVRGNRAKAEGVRKGVPDIFLPVPRVNYGWGEDFHGLYIELKRPDSVGKKAGSTSQVQDEWTEYLRSAGYAVEVCVGWLEARACLMKYLGIS
jgi:hypothetical protein